MVDIHRSTPQEEILIEQARLVDYRLERISADSIWAHRSSGLRGGLLRSIDQIEAGLSSEEISPERREAGLKQLKSLIATGFEMLERAAREKIGS